MHHDHKADSRAAFMGLILGAIFILTVCSTIVHLTNRHYANETAAGESAMPGMEH